LQLLQRREERFPRAKWDQGKEIRKSGRFFVFCMNCIDGSDR
jgi:hypothetical protein